MARNSASSARNIILWTGLIVVMFVGAWALWKEYVNKPAPPVPGGVALPDTPDHSNDSAQLRKASLNEKQGVESREEPFISQEGLASVPPNRFFTTSGMDHLTPRDREDTFRTDQEVYVYAALHAPSRETVSISWFDGHGKKILPTAYMDVGINTSERGYRIFTYRVFREPGTYAVKIYNSTGVLIGEAGFSVVEAE